MVRVFVREHSREYSLFRIYGWYLCITRILPKRELYPDIKNHVMVYRKGGLAEAYYDPVAFANVYNDFLEDYRDIATTKKTITRFLDLFDGLLPYFTLEKKLQDIAELKTFFDQYLEFWSLVSFIFAIPVLPLVDVETRDMAMQAREKTQEYAEASEPVIRNILEKEYPHLKGKTQFVLPEEAWSGEAGRPEILEKITEREKGFVVYCGEVYTGSVDETLRKLDIELSAGIEVEKETKEIKGQIAQKGIAQGMVKVVSSLNDLKKVTAGDVLVAAMTVPNYISAMKRAGAFITDEGGVTCHAAIIAREMSKPCIIGTRIATSVLKDGDLIEVDANAGVVRIIKKS